MSLTTASADHPGKPVFPLPRAVLMLSGLFLGEQWEATEVSGSDDWLIEFVY